MKKKVYPPSGMFHLREIEKNQYATVSLGSVDKNYPKSIYLDIKSWTNVYNPYDDYQAAIKRLRKNIKTLLFNTLNEEIFNRDFVIVDVDYPVTMSKQYNAYGRDRFFRLEITLRQKNMLGVKDETLLKELYDIVKLISVIFEDHGVFKFNKNKQYSDVKN